MVCNPKYYLILSESKKVTRSLPKVNVEWVYNIFHLVLMTTWIQLLFLLHIEASNGCFCVEEQTYLSFTSMNRQIIIIIYNFIIMDVKRFPCRKFFIIVLREYKCCFEHDS